MEFLVLGIRPAGNRSVVVDAVNAYGRRVGAVVAWWQTTADGIQDALERSYELELDADRDREGALQSIEADFHDPPVP